MHSQTCNQKLTRGPSLLFQAVPAAWTSANLDRRCHPRQIVYSAVCVDLDPNNIGLLDDLSEGGLALDLFVPVVSEQTIRLGFDLPGTNDRIGASCQIAWIDDSGQKAGVRFVDLPERSRQQIKEWLSDRGLAQSPKLDFGLLRDLRSALVYPQRISEPEQGEQETLEQEGTDRRIGEMNLKPWRLAGLFMGVVALSGLILVFGYMVGLKQFFSKPRAAPTADKETVLPSDSLGPPAKPPGASATGWMLSAPLIQPGGVVIQVAALTRESDALGMAEALRKKQFPAFVLMPTTDHYYRVQVGPYTDTQSAAIFKRALEREGFEVIIKIKR